MESFLGSFPTAYGSTLTDQYPPPEEYERQLRVARIVRPIAVILLIVFFALLAWRAME